MKRQTGTDFDVVVIGAGPAGSTTAKLLAGTGFRVLLADRAQFPRDKICGDCINPGCWDYFRMLGISDAVAGSAETISRIDIAGASGRRVTLTVPARRQHPFVAMKRILLDEILLRNALSTGVQFEERSALENAICQDFWDISLRDTTTGELRSVTSSYLVGADGRNSRTASLLSARNGRNTRDARTGPDRVGIRWTLKRPPELGSSLYLFFFRGGYGGMVGISSAEANVALSVPPALARQAAADYREFSESAFSSHPMLRGVSDGNPDPADLISTYPLQPRRNTSRFDTAFLVGDARQTLEPFTGEGILFAMQDAVNCARRISALSGRRLLVHAPSIKSQYRINKIFSPILHAERFREFLLRMAARLPGMARIAANTVIR